MSTLIQNLTLPLVAVVGLIVLIALHDVTAAVGLPIIAGIVGVHIGAYLPNPAPNTTTSQSTTGPIQ